MGVLPSVARLSCTVGWENYLKAASWLVGGCPGRDRDELKSGVWQKRMEILGAH